MMKQNLKNLIRSIVAVITVTLMIMGCTTTDKKCMPLTSSSKKARDLAWEAQKLIADGFTPEGVVMLKQALELDSNFVAANLWYGRNAGLGTIERQKYIKRAERNISNVPEAEQHMIKSYLASERGDREAIVNELKAIIDLYPEDKYMLRLLAVRYYGQGQYENALEYARKSYEADTSFATIVYYQGFILWNMGKTDEAETFFKKAVKMNPSVPLYYNNYGQMLRSVGRIDEAMEMHKKALAIKSDQMGNLYLGHCYAAKGNFATARESYLKAFDVATNNTQKNNDLIFIASSYLYESDLPGACSAFDKRTDFNRQLGTMNVEVINSIVNKGFCFLMYDDPVNYEKYIKEATELASTLTLTETDRINYEKYAIFWKGWFQALTGKADDAKKSLEEFKSSMKDEAELKAMDYYWNTFQGIVSFSKKNWTDAVSFFTLANSPVTDYYMGLAYLNEGDIDKAKIVFSKIVNNNLIGLQRAMVTPFVKNKLDELNSK